MRLALRLALAWPLESCEPLRGADADAGLELAWVELALPGEAAVSVLWLSVVAHAPIRSDAASAVKIRVRFICPSPF
jgi:hypothetical protein